MTNAQLVRAIVHAANDAATLTTWTTTPNPDTLPRALWSYVRSRTTYAAENGTQRIRYPSAFVRDRVGDCKTQAVFIASLARAAGCRVSLRFIRQNGGRYWSHVYAIVNGTVCDPLLPLGQEAEHDYALTVPIP